MSEQGNQELPKQEETVAETNPIHEDFIKSAPEELRDAASQLAPVWDSYVQSKFQEAAEFRKQFEGLTQEDAQDYLAFKEIQQDPQKLVEWYNQWGTVLQQQHPDLFQQSDTTEDDFGLYEDITQNPQFQQLQREIQAQNEWIQSQQQEASLRQADEYVSGELGKIKQDHPYLTDQDLDDICALANRYVPDDPSQETPDDLIQRGFKDFQALIGRTERSLFEKKDNQPKPAQHGGGIANSAEPITDFAAAAEAARRLVIQSKGT